MFASASSVLLAERNKAGGGRKKSARRIKLSPYNTWSAKFKKTFVARLGALNGIKSEEDMESVKQVTLVVRDGVCTLEVVRFPDIIEVAAKDLPVTIRRQLKQAS
jgi:hypothetical protein